MLDKNELKSVMALKGHSQLDLAEALGITEQSMSYKINGKQPFKSNEIYKIKKLYSLTPNQIDTIFFGNHNIRTV
jgi:DNA-binding XRE family transcriptional regulator